MCDFVAINRQGVIAFLETYRDSARQAEIFRDVEHGAAVSIQRLFRGACVREAVQIKRDAATEIERVFRGHMGRLKVKNAYQTRDEYRQLCLFQYFAAQIQKSFRGYYSRKYRQNHFTRKAYFKTIIEKNVEIREQLARYAEEQTERDAMDAEMKKEGEFKTYAENLHHLVSTKQIRGIYNPREEFLEVPTMYNLPVEDHIRGVVKDLLRTRGITKTGLITDMNGTKKIPYKGLLSRLTLQASAHYDMPKREKMRMSVLHKILSAGKGNFFTGGKTRLLEKNDQPLCVGDPYMDSWANPLLVKGVPQDQAQLKKSIETRRPLYNLAPEKPYYTRTGGNMSTTIANDVFDVIADAKESGGAILRHLGSSARFGLPSNCDYRPVGGSAPQPPLRTTTIIAPRAGKRRAVTAKVALISTSHSQSGLASVDSDDSDKE